MEERASRVLQGQHVQTRNRSLNQNRKMPFSGSGFVLKGGFARESGGTGVFHPHPRINDNASNTTSTATVAKKQSELLIVFCFFGFCDVSFFRFLLFLILMFKYGFFFYLP